MTAYGPTSSDIRAHTTIIVTNLTIFLINRNKIIEIFSPKRANYLKNWQSVDIFFKNCDAFHLDKPSRTANRSLNEDRIEHRPLLLEEV